MNVRPYLNFNGTCAEAFAFYVKVFAGEITFAMKYEDSPMANQRPEMRGKILHSTMTAGDILLQGADAPPEIYRQPHGISVNLNVSTAADAERIFHGLSEGGQVTMPIQKTFWADRFGMCTDRFGIPWMVMGPSSQTAA